MIERREIDDIEKEVAEEPEKVEICETVEK